MLNYLCRSWLTTPVSILCSQWEVLGLREGRCSYPCRGSWNPGASRKREWLLLNFLKSSRRKRWLSFLGISFWLILALLVTRLFCNSSTVSTIGNQSTVTSVLFFYREHIYFCITEMFKVISEKSWKHNFVLDTKSIHLVLLCRNAFFLLRCTENLTFPFMSSMDIWFKMGTSQFSHNLSQNGMIVDDFVEKRKFTVLLLEWIWHYHFITFFKA